MRRRTARPITLVTLPALALALAVVALSNGQQGPPGGSSSGGSWTIDYQQNGTDYTGNGTGPSTPWPPPGGNWMNGSGYGSGRDVASSGSALQVKSMGSVNIRARWTGSGTAPTTTWLLVQSSATWDSGNGSGSAMDAFNDQPKPYSETTMYGLQTGQISFGQHVYRLSGGSLSAGFSVAANATVSGQGGASRGAHESVGVYGSITDKNASLARRDGESLTISGNTYSANTLLSWDNSDGVNPGPTYQSLTGTYGGTWTKLSDGTTDSVIITWSGATPAGGSTIGPIPGQDHHTTSYPASSSGGKMPTADGSGSSKTQDWKYSVSDQGDGTKLDLTCHWICHYAYETFVANTDPAQQQSNDTSTSYLTTLPADASAVVHVPAGGFPATTSFYHDDSDSIPGFIPADKHVGIAAYLARAGKTAPNSWSAHDLTVTANQGDGYYGTYYELHWPRHVGTVTAWNALGANANQSFGYALDTDSSLETIEPYFRAGDGGM